MKKICIVLINC